MTTTLSNADPNITAINTPKRRRPRKPQDALGFTPKNQEKLNETKKYLCQLINQLINKNGWSQRDAARYLWASEACISLIGNRKVEKLTFNQLFTILASLNPYFKILIAL